MSSTGHNNGRDDATERNDLSPQASLAIREIELLLSEKRTALSVMRTGIAILALPLSVFSALIVTSRFYTLEKVLHWLIPLLLLCAGLVGLALYLVVRAMTRAHAIDHAIERHKARFREIADLI